MNESKIQYIKDWCEEHYPEHKFCIARDRGDVLEVFLQSPEFTMGDCKIVHYNTWYPGEFSVYKIVPEDYHRDEKIISKTEYLPTSPKVKGKQNG